MNVTKQIVKKFKKWIKVFPYVANIAAFSFIVGFAEKLRDGGNPT